MSISLNKEDFYPIGQVAKHCNLEKLQIAINEAILFDLKPLLCGLFYEVNENWNDTEGIWFDIIEPLEFEGCNDRPRSHQGLKNVLIRYAYARYLIINATDDTPNGTVNKTNEWSIPKPFADIKQNSERYRNMGFDLWKEVEEYICIAKGVYVNADFDCKSCGCNGKCGSKTKIKGFGIKGSNISKGIYSHKHHRNGRLR